MLSKLDEDRIEAAVREAEDGTSGEIVCALATEVSNYREVPLAWAALVSLALPPVFTAFWLEPLVLYSNGGGWMMVGPGAMEAQLAFALVVYAAAQVALFIGVALLLRLPALRRRVTPGSLKRHRVAKAAQHQFAAISARAIGSDTGILIFVSLEDRQVQILADKGIHDKAGDALWNQAAAAIAGAMKGGHDPTSGIIEAVQLCGAALREHYPAEKGRPHAFKARPMEV